MVIDNDGNERTDTEVCIQRSVDVTCVAADAAIIVCDLHDSMFLGNPTGYG